LLRDFEMIGQAGKTQEAFRTAADHFFREGFFVRNEGAAATGAGSGGGMGGVHFFTRRQRQRRISWPGTC